ncbi:hypothetical protein Hypma_001412 [Hypsizygus marmoreus]|uniref:Uncharacterized protein n=1 Tax=Hypsizygus marmoreus TaxID=39966 RepID=A0A369K917_HYPMA|nr:hypothetical protein Hypma_001412 [Hypsizygus marmoreus]
MSTHLGNSLVLYYPSSLSTTPVAGSIEKITISSSGVQLAIKRQARLPPGLYDPFRRYPSFPARVYSSKMDDGPADMVSFDSVVSHVARYTFSSNRAVILNLSRSCLNNMIIAFEFSASQLLPPQERTMSVRSSYAQFRNLRNGEFQSPFRSA